MKINGKDINFAYTIGAYCDFSDYCAGHPEVSLARASVYKALYCNRAYVQMHEGADTITLEEVMALPQDKYNELMAEVKKAEDSGSKRSVETVEGKKNVNKPK